MKTVWRLRWAYISHDGKTKYGQWSRHADRPEDMAAFVNPEKQKTALIQGKNLENSEIRNFVEMPASAVVNFRWNMVSRVPMGRIGSGITSPGMVVGITMDTTENSYTVFADGSLKFQPRNPDLNKISLKRWEK